MYERGEERLLALRTCFHEVGVLVTGDANPTIDDNVVANSDIGVQVGGSAEADLNGNTFLASAVAAVSYGEDSTGTVRRSPAQFA